MFGIEIALYVIVGIAAGFLSGLLGIGGGIVAIPCLFAIFKSLHIHSDSLMQVIVATSLSSMILNTFVSAAWQQKHHNIDWNLAIKLVIGIVIGCIVGAKTALDISSNVLKILFGAFMCLLGSYLYLKAARISDKQPENPALLTTIAIGFANSFIATILGISGGILIVPILQGLHIPIKKAIGVSSATSFVTALVGSFAFILFNEVTSTNPHQVGLIYLPAFICITIAATIFAPLGVKVSHQLHFSKLRKIFGLVVFFVGLYMIIQM